MLPFVYLPTALCQTLEATFPGQRSEIANSTESARSAVSNCPLSSTILPSCQIHFTPVDCPNELQAAHKLKKFQGLNDFFWSAQNFVPESQTAPMCVCVFFPLFP